MFCGLSGSGKSSLALDTLYAEGQRRYIESFSAYTRQFLQRLEKPEAERIDGIPPAIAVTGKNTGRSSRSTVGTATETNDYLRLLMAKIGEVFCLKCGRPVRCDSPQSAAETLAALPAGTRYMIAFPCQLPDGKPSPWPSPGGRGDDRATGGRIARGRLCPGGHRRAAGEPGCDGREPSEASRNALPLRGGRSQEHLPPRPQSRGVPMS